MRKFIAMLAAITVLGACQCGPDVFADPVHSAGDVLKVATDHMASRGMVMENYELDALTYDYVDKEWSLFYSGKSLGVGDHFTVRISDSDTNKITVVPGL